VVVGTSIGGTIALDFALSHPEDVAALVLIDAQVRSQSSVQGLGIVFLLIWLGACRRRASAERRLPLNVTAECGPGLPTAVPKKPARSFCRSATCVCCARGSTY
jgi:pimeloyl-ACP methyl ester carboxylesterase